jgi:hypothetical protein
MIELECPLGEILRVPGLLMEDFLPWMTPSILGELIFLPRESCTKLLDFITFFFPADYINLPLFAFISHSPRSKERYWADI